MKSFLTAVGAGLACPSIGRAVAAVTGDPSSGWLVAIGIAFVIYGLGIRDDA